MRKILVVVSLLALCLTLIPVGAIAGRASGDIRIQEYVVPADTMNEVRGEWIDGITATHPAGTWAPLKFEPNNSQLDRLGLPSKEVLLSQRYPVPTMVDKFGRKERVELPTITSPAGTLGPTVATFAGAGWFGIRPGAFLLLLNGGSIGWCSMAHVYGSPGAYKISTAGHCGKVGDVATVIAAFGNRAGVLNPILLDIGKFSTSHDNSLGDDWALIDVHAAWQSLVSPTMAFWGGPRGMYTKTGSTAAISVGRRIPSVPTVSTNADPYLAQTLVHYGHGTGVGAGGTPRAGETIHWATSWFMFFGAISPGDSGSGANTLTGDTLGANMEAAGIMTHLWVDPLMKSGLGIMGGTRATRVTGTLANGQIVPYPIPVTGLP